MERVNFEDLNLFNKSSRWVIAGLSGSGKSYFTSELIRKYRHVFSKVYVIGSDLENVGDIDVVRNDNFNPFDDESELVGETLIIFDDIIFNNSLIKLAAEVYSRGRHINVSSVFLSQNLYLKNDFYRVISINATHVVLFRARDINQIKYFGKSFLDDNQNKNFVSLYKKQVLKQKYGYLLVDFTQDIDSPLRMRTDILNEKKYMKAFQI